jgi:hypothetical protein
MARLPEFMVAADIPSRDKVTLLIQKMVNRDQIPARI